VNEKTASKVPRESVYDAEMYRLLINWLKKCHDIDIISQWHLESIASDGFYHHSYCDLTLKDSNQSSPLAILELVATATTASLEKHFNQIFKYAQQLHPTEFWLVHFSCEDNFILDPYWPEKKLQQDGLNVVHFWHDKNFKNVRMSAKFSNTNNVIEEIIDHQILP
jgi:hypothetical protein